jgi:hypothetical protein
MGATQSFVPCLYERNRFNIDGGKGIDLARQNLKKKHLKSVFLQAMFNKLTVTYMYKISVIKISNALLTKNEFVLLKYFGVKDLVFL